MRNNFFLILCFTILITSCNTGSEDYLVKIHNGKADEIGTQTGYVNSKGDTIIPIGKFNYCYTDTIRKFGIVLTKENVPIGIDKKQNKLFEVFWFDNGPDYVSDGLFRIVKDKKIGYADENGNIVITPKFDCAFPFEKGIAKVSTNCQTESDGEHSMWKSESWIYIDKRGKQVKSNVL